MRMRKLRNHEYLTQAEVQALFTVIQSKRDQALFRLVYHLGLRRREIRALNRNDFADDQPLLGIHGRWGLLGNRYPLERDELRILRRYIRQERGNKPGPLFTGPDRRKALSASQLDRLMKQYCGLAGIPREKRQLTALRHACAVHMVQRGEKLEDVYFWFGFRNWECTWMYLPFSPDPLECLKTPLLDWGNGE